MAAVEDEYGRFMQWLRDQGVTPDAKRVAKIVEVNLDDVEQSVSAAGQRARVLATLLRCDLAQTDEQIEAEEREEGGASLPWTRLQRLSVGPFRGFRRPEQFDLRKDVVLFYGPNGSGKTSLCEALEFTLLGHVEEASAKRFGSLEDYFDNIHEDGHVAPQLWAENGNGGVLVEANEELLRFAIIEKNRIEGFGRLAARAPAQANTMIATLFGLESFNEFVNNFTSTLDSQLKLATPLKIILERKQAELEAARQKIAASDETSRAFDEQQEKIANEFEEGCTHALLLELLGTPETPGRIQEIVSKLDEQIPPPSGVSMGDVVALRRTLREKRLALAECEEKLRERAAEVSYRGLYSAIKKLEAGMPSVCPACETPLDSVVSNPFERATRGLELLQDLAELEAEQVRLLGECERLSSQLKQIMATAEELGVLDAALLAPLVEWIRGEGHEPIWMQGLVTKEVWRGWLNAVRGLERKDAQIRERLEKRNELVIERDRLEHAKEQLAELGGRRAQHVAQIASEQELITKFDELNAKLSERVAQEAEQYQLEIRIQKSYTDYLEAIRRYKDGLPEGLLADLNETTRDLYNQINADDHESDKLTSLALPTRGGERIQVAFGGSPGDMHDALHVLSEGHLRCLGLAILLAKNIKLGLPIVVFDDAVNAIDHDHRAGIRATLFGDERLREKQILMTSHSNEFVKDIQNQLGQQQSILYVLGYHAGDHQPLVRNGSDRHYLVRARERLDDGDQRQCLASCRQSLENLSWRMWKSLYNRSDELGKMLLLLRSPTSRPELRGVTDALVKNIALGRERGVLQGDAWERRGEGLQEILAIPERHLAWQYFNKGTHDEEDREDFEIQVVRQIVGALEKISASF